MEAQSQGLMIDADAGPGILHRLTGVIAGHNGDIGTVSIIENTRAGARVYFEVTTSAWEAMLEELRSLPIVRTLDLVKSMQEIYGKRIIIMGGGAQVAQVAIGAIVEADRHNIRGEHISVDTIPLVGEQPLADAVRAVPRLAPGACAGARGRSHGEGGDIETRAVREVRETGLLEGDQPEYGGQRSRGGRPGSHGSSAGGRDGGDGRRGYREVHSGTFESSRILSKYFPVTKLPARR